MVAEGSGERLVQGALVDVEVFGQLLLRGRLVPVQLSENYVCEKGLVIVEVLGQICVLKDVLMEEVFGTDGYERKRTESLVCKEYVIIVERSGVLRMTSKCSVISW